MPRLCLSAQGQLEALEKKYGPTHRDVAAALNNLAQLYGSQGRDAEAEPLLQARHRHFRENIPELIRSRSHPP